VSRLRLTQVTTPSNPPASTVELYAASAGTGQGTPVAIQAIDSSGNVAMLGHFSVLDYRLLRVSVLVATNASYSPANGTVVAKGGSGGAVMAAAATFAQQAGGAGGAAASGTGDLKISGSVGDRGIRLSGTQAWSGDGGSAALLGLDGANGVIAITGGTAGSAAVTTSYGAGGSGAATLTTQQAGGAGAGGMARIWEFA
jgi:hypothetical protein